MNWEMFIFHIVILAAICFAEVFKPVPKHEGIIPIEKGKIFTNQRFIRIRFDMSLEKWYEQKRIAQNIYSKLMQPNKTAFNDREITPVLENLKDISTEIDPQSWIQRLQGAIQPLSQLLPEEKIDDTVNVDIDTFIEAKDTYYLPSACQHSTHAFPTESCIRQDESYCKPTGPRRNSRNLHKLSKMGRYPIPQLGQDTSSTQ